MIGPTALVRTFGWSPTSGGCPPVFDMHPSAWLRVGARPLPVRYQLASDRVPWAVLGASAVPSARAWKLEPRDGTNPKLTRAFRARVETGRPTRPVIWPNSRTAIVAIWNFFQIQAFRARAGLARSRGKIAD